MDGQTVGQKLATALALLDDGIDLMRCRLRRERPDLSPEQVDILIEQWLRPAPGHLQGSAAPFFRLRKAAH